jgi:hypothetical protein
MKHLLEVDMTGNFFLRWVFLRLILDHWCCGGREKVGWLGP